jgi:hypothetical protein
MKRLILLMMMLAGVSACQPQAEQALPTAISLELVGTQNAQSATENAPPPTATSRSLPPTFTPTAEQPPTLEPTNPPTPTPPGFSGSGTIYYIYNGDSIAAVNADGTNNNIIITFGVGIPITDLTLSNNGELLAYVAPGSGSAREVYISSRDGSYTQAVSCLGMSDVKYVSWMADNEHLLFFAATTAGVPGDIYMVSYVGANTCPTGNAQQIVIPFQSNDIRGITSNRQGTIIYYTGGGDALYAWELATGNRRQVTYASGFGKDTSPVASPTDDRLVYLRFMRNPDGLTGNEVVTLVSTNRLPRETLNPSGAFIQALTAAWSADGTAVVITTASKVYLFDFSDGSIAPLFEQILVAPDAAARPDAREIAYTNINATGVEQIFVYNREEQTSRQLTDNPEGTISNLVWGGDVKPEQ